MSSALKVRMPNQALAPFVQLFWLGEDERTDVFPIIPDGCIDIVMRCGGRLPSQVSVYGSATSFQTIDILPSHRYLGIRFHPGQARHFVHIPAWQLTNTYCDSESHFLSFLHPVIGESHPERALAMLEHYCFKWLVLQSPTTGFIDRLLLNLSMQYNTPLSQFCHQHGISERHLQRQCRDVVGMSPKLFTRILRAHKVKALFEAKVDTPLAHMAIAAGYADQSHMQREIKLFFGHTPMYLRNQE